MSIDPRAIADETGVDEEDVVAVLDALDEADSTENEADDDEGLNGVDPNDPFWETAGMLSSGEDDLSETVDEEPAGSTVCGETPEAALDALDTAGRDGDDDRTAVEERTPEEIMTELERLLDERDSDEPVFDPSGAGDDIYAREHVENLKQLTTDRE